MTKLGRRTPLMNKGQTRLSSTSLDNVKDKVIRIVKKKEHRPMYGKVQHK